MASVAFGLLVAVVMIASLLVDPGSQCMPGSGHIRRRPNRKQGRLLYKQRVPDLSETSLGSSGESEGPIHRRSQRFKDLVSNGNQDIAFKESVPNVRIMSQRCKDRLNSLSILVLNTWPGLKLRVIRAWDETEEANQSAVGFMQSLHQDGRAVDITTSDRDRDKLGVLAGLAVDAGFDWVFYETRGHVHCSVKQDSYMTSKIGACFPGHEFVHLENGTSLPMSAVRLGDRVLAVRSDDASPVFDSVIAFLHRSRTQSAEFVVIRTAAGSVSLTPDHLVMTTTEVGGNGSGGNVRQAHPAGGVRVGQFVHEVRRRLVGGLAEATVVVPSRVIGVSYSVGRGVYAPLTAEGTIVVGGYVASCYGVISSHRLAHAAFLPIRVANELLGSSHGQGSRKDQPSDDYDDDDDDDDDDDEGIHWYAGLLYRVFRSILPDEFWYRKF